MPIADFLNHQQAPFIAFDALSAASINSQGVQQNHFVLVTNGTYKGKGTEVTISYNANLVAPLAVLADYGFIKKRFTAQLDFNLSRFIPNCEGPCHFTEQLGPSKFNTRLFNLAQSWSSRRSGTTCQFNALVAYIGFLMEQ